MGDLDEVDFIEDVERRFGIAFDESDYAHWHTIGDVHTSLARRLGGLEQPGGACATQMTFYRLRRMAGSANANATPGTLLSTLGLGGPRRTLATLGRCGLDVPGATYGTLGSTALLGTVLTALALGIGIAKWDAVLTQVAAVGLVVSFLLLTFAPKRYSEDIETLGDLARFVARHNIMMLKAHGAGLERDLV